MPHAANEVPISALAEKRLPRYENAAFADNAVASLCIGIIFAKIRQKQPRFS
jgi:hypothetical protein